MCPCGEEDVSGSESVGGQGWAAGPARSEDVLGPKHARPVESQVHTGGPCPSPAGLRTFTHGEQCWTFSP